MNSKPDQGRIALMATLLTWICFAPGAALAGDGAFSAGGRAVIAPDEDEHVDGMHITLAAGETDQSFFRASVGSQSGPPIGGISARHLGLPSEPQWRNVALGVGASGGFTVTEQFKEGHVSLGLAQTVHDHDLAISNLASIAPLFGITDRGSRDRYYCAGGGDHVEVQAGRFVAGGKVLGGSCVKRGDGDDHATFAAGELRAGLLIGKKAPHFGVYTGFEKRVLTPENGDPHRERIISLSVGTARHGTAAAAW